MNLFRWLTTSSPTQASKNPPKKAPKKPKNPKKPPKKPKGK